MAYQGFGQGADRTFIAAQIRLLDIVPDLTVVLDVSDAVAAERLLARGGDADRYERLDSAFHGRVRAGFRAIGAAEPARCVLVDAAADIDAVHTGVMQAVRGRLGLS